MGEEQDGPAQVRPVDRLRARAGSTDRAGRFTTRLAEVEQAQRRRRVVRAALWCVQAAAAAVVGAVAVVAWGGITGVDPRGTTVVVGAVVGGVGLLVARVVAARLARRRGAQAWDWYRGRHVLLGDPSSRVRDADRPAPSAGPTPPPRR